MRPNAEPHVFAIFKRLWYFGQLHYILVKGAAFLQVNHIQGYVVEGNGGLRSGAFHHGPG